MKFVNFEPWERQVLKQLVSAEARRLERKWRVVQRGMPDANHDPDNHSLKLTRYQSSDYKLPLEERRAKWRKRAKEKRLKRKRPLAKH